jgi:hypothetical protein
MRFYQEILWEDDALLGLDILMKGEGGPADIKLTEGIILLNKTKIPCIQIGQPETLRRAVKGCPLALASILDFCKVGLLESGILWKFFAETTVLAAPVSAVKVIFIPCMAHIYSITFNNLSSNGKFWTRSTSISIHYLFCN